jgi:hypothetical protein
MICTSAFSTGNDYSSVRLVIHMKMPLEMTELIQAQGRGGRDGRHARCYVLPNSTPAKIAIGRLEVDHKGLWHARDYAYKYSIKNCLRHASTAYIDGTGTWCKDDVANEPCSFCTNGPKGLGHGHTPSKSHFNNGQTPGESHGHGEMTSLKRPIEEISTDAGDPFSEAFEKAKKFRTERLEGEMMEVERMRKALDKIKDRGCALCLTTGHSEGRLGHSIFQCPSFERVKVSRQAYMAWKKEIRYFHHKGICWRCHVPTCGDELHRPLVAGEATCDWPDIVIPIAFGILRDDKLRSGAEKKFNADWMKDGSVFAKWLAKRPEKGRLSNGMDLLLWFVETYLN